MHVEANNLEQRIHESKDKQQVKEKIVDTAVNVAAPLAFGAALDYFTGLDITGIAAARGTSIATNAVSGAPYGMWRNHVYTITKTSESSSRKRKCLAEILSFNTFQMPLYGFAIAVGSLVSEGKVDWEKVRDGSLYLAAASPLAGPAMGYCMDYFRNWFGVKSAAQKVGAADANDGKK